MAPRASDARGARIPRAGSTATGRTPARLARAVEFMVQMRIERAERDARWQERSHCAAPTLPLAQNVSPEAEVAEAPSSPQVGSSRFAIFSAIVRLGGEALTNRRHGLRLIHKVYR